MKLTLNHFKAVDKYVGVLSEFTTFQPLEIRLKNFGLILKSGLMNI